MTGQERLVVVGGDAAGMSAAAQARRRRPDLSIIVFEKGSWTSYSACGIPYYVGMVVDGIESLVVRSPATFRDKYDIDVRTRHEVIGIDTARRRVRVRRIEQGDELWESYDHLLLATGGVHLRPDLPGVGSGNIHVVSTLGDAAELRRIIDRERPEAAVIVGGGYIGLEMAEALIRREMRVSLVQRPPQVMGTMDQEMGSIISNGLRQFGVNLHLNEQVTGFQSYGGKVSGVVTDRQTLPAELVILGMGVRPASELAEAAGIPLGVKGAIRVDEGMRTGTEGVWAAGDCAESYHLVSRLPVYIALGTVANKQGRVAGTNIGGGHALFPGVVGTAVTKVFGMEIARTGLNERECAHAGIPWVEASIKSLTRAGYYPHAEEITVKLLAEPGSGRLLGGQIVGGGGSAKRIDVVATALHAGMTVDDLINLDLGYAPPYSSVWDPLQIAAKALAKKV